MVRRTEQRQQLQVGKEFIAVLHALVRLANQIESMLLDKLRDNIRLEDRGYAPVTFIPAVILPVWICPEKIA